MLRFVRFGPIVIGQIGKWCIRLENIEKLCNFAIFSDLSDYNRTKSDKSEKMALFSSFRPYFVHPIISDAQLSDLVRFKSDKSENVFWPKLRFFPHRQNHPSWHIPSWVPCMCTYNKVCDTPYLIGSRFCVNLIKHILSSDFSDFSEKIGCIRHSVYGPVWKMAFTVWCRSLHATIIPH